MPSTDNLTLSDLPANCKISFQYHNGSAWVQEQGWIRSIVPHGDNYWVILGSAVGGQKEHKAFLLSDMDLINTPIQVQKIVKKPEDLFGELAEKLNKEEELL